MVDTPDFNPVSESNRRRKHERDFRAWQLKAEKRTLKEIREILIVENYGDIKESTISSAIHRIDSENREGMHESIATMRMQVVHFNNHLMREAMLAWDKSKLPAVVKKSKRKLKGQEGSRETIVEQDEEGNDVEVVAENAPNYGPQYEKDQSKTVTYRDGDPRYLAVALQANVANAKILGLEHPKQINMTVDNNTVAMDVNRKIDEATEGLSVDKIRELSKLANEMVQLKKSIDNPPIDVDYRQLEDQTDD